MSKINDPIEFRKNIINNIKNKLRENNYIPNDCENEKLENDELDEIYIKYAKNLEKGVYNYCINQSTERNIVKKWDNPYFVQIYTDHLYTIISNLNNKTIIKKLENKEIKVHEIAFMTHQDMNEKRWEKLLEAKKLKEE
jgi:hypothetical protein